MEKQKDVANTGLSGPLSGELHTFLVISRSGVQGGKSGSDNGSFYGTFQCE